MLPDKMFLLKSHKIFIEVSYKKKLEIKKVFDFASFDIILFII